MSLVKADTSAFVIWVEPPGAGERELRGRVEHVQSAERVPFESAEELLRFLEQSLRSRAPGEKPPGGG